jgi:transcriptional regulator
MQAHPLGALITCGEGGWMPTTCRSSSMGAGAHGVLRAHVARNNPLWQEVKDGDEVLVIFRAAEGYLPSWYPGKQVHHQQVPTWNYAVVHAHGRIG